MADPWRWGAPPLGCRFQSRKACPVAGSIRSSFWGRRYWPQEAVAWNSLADSSTQKVMPNDDGNVVFAGGAEKSAVPSSPLPTPLWASSSNSSGDSSCRLGASMPTR